MVLNHSHNTKCRGPPVESFLWFHWRFVELVWSFHVMVRICPQLTSPYTAHALRLEKRVTRPCVDKSLIPRFELWLSSAMESRRVVASWPLVLGWLETSHYSLLEYTECNCIVIV
ncbi:hypothetical protein VNO77_02043 [Canavalia gladiata]|uniref:Uncharacterized protein n=1 Tax=Canavalia gladiata TaxID=3824 RepID=A0AAN9MS95_CANGL